MRERTSQEEFWEGQFGDDYTDRNQPAVAGRQRFFRRVLGLTYGVVSICELGANRGHNLEALGGLSPNYDLTGVELNRGAVERLKELPNVTAVHSAILDYEPERQFDLVFTCGVLIHVNPADLQSTYVKMKALSSRYVLVNEYWNPSPVEIGYRGHEQKLFKRDFLGELMDSAGGDMRVLDYGFLWSRLEPDWDNTTWALLEKTR